ncbi:MAG: glycerate kinase [candidate division NC10 bacterium RIFCSPLOWO2_02_FULL_66_22]|nr:MAG: glycerate kinase [candidate division NC10 bacterium RIFCSPLOWO2_02_FULL_66_22]
MQLDELRKAARRIFDAAVRAVDPAEAVRRHVRREDSRLRVGQETLDLGGVHQIVVVGCGKAAAPMAAAVEDVLGDRISRGVVVTKYGHVQPTRMVRIHEAGHPVPDDAGIKGAEAILDHVRGLGPKDLVLVLISGGGSALTPAPVDGISLSEKQALTKSLLACGADIREINTLRKHISRVKGGQLARVAQPARVVALILSDIVGDPLDAIASGPTVPDPTTFADALRILDTYRIRGEIPATVRARLEAGTRGEVPETPKPDDPLFARVHNLIVGSNIQALEAARSEAHALGLTPMILSSSIEGETREIARMHAALAREIRTSGNPVTPPACLISGGETTVTLRGSGKGGRNQEFVLAAALDIAGLPETVILSAGTDGTDGPTDAAGAIADGETCLRALALGLNPRAALDGNDAYPFFAKLGDLILTGPTNTNVMDVRLILAG